MTKDGGDKTLSWILKIDGEEYHCVLILPFLWAIKLLPPKSMYTKTQRLKNNIKNFSKVV